MNKYLLLSLLVSAVGACLASDTREYLCVKNFDAPLDERIGDYLLEKVEKTAIATFAAKHGSAAASRCMDEYGGNFAPGTRLTIVRADDGKVSYIGVVQKDGSLKKS